MVVLFSIQKSKKGGANMVKKTTKKAPAKKTVAKKPVAKKSTAKKTTSAKRSATKTYYLVDRKGNVKSTVNIK